MTESEGLKKYKFITVRRDNAELFEGKPVYRVFNNRSNSQLAILSYYKPWKQYVFSSQPHCVFNDSWESFYQCVRRCYRFGHGETKATCLWLKGLPPLKPTNIVGGREGRVWKESPGADRVKSRSRTYLGIANAMAEQWSENLISP